MEVEASTDAEIIHRNIMQYNHKYLLFFLCHRALSIVASLATVLHSCRLAYIVLSCLLIVRLSCQLNFIGREKEGDKFRQEEAEASNESGS